MKKKVWIGGVILIVLTIILIAYPSLYPSPKTKVKTLSNVTELYSLFTPYMESYVNSRVQAIECQPNRYYYNENISSILERIDQ